MILPPAKKMFNDTVRKNAANLPGHTWEEDVRRPFLWAHQIEKCSSDTTGYFPTRRTIPHQQLTILLFLTHRLSSSFSVIFNSYADSEEQWNSRCSTWSFSLVSVASRNASTPLWMPKEVKTLETIFRTHGARNLKRKYMNGQRKALSKKIIGE